MVPPPGYKFIPRTEPSCLSFGLCQHVTRNQIVAIYATLQFDSPGKSVKRWAALSAMISTASAVSPRSLKRGIP